MRGRGSLFFFSLILPGAPVSEDHAVRRGKHPCRDLEMKGWREGTRVWVVPKTPTKGTSTDGSSGTEASEKVFFIPRNASNQKEGCRAATLGAFERREREVLLAKRAESVGCSLVRIFLLKLPNAMDDCGEGAGNRRIRCQHANALFGDIVCVGTKMQRSRGGD